MTLRDVEGIFPTERAVVDLIIRRCYGGAAVCRHCGSGRVYRRRNSAKVFDCNACGNTFSPFTGTILEKSATDLRKWVCAARLAAGGRGVSGAGLMEAIGVTYKTAWRMLRQLREAQGDAGQRALLAALAAADVPAGQPATETAESGAAGGGPGSRAVGGEAKRMDLSQPHVRVYGRGW